jgi:hypothetical protein
MPLCAWASDVAKSGPHCLEVGFLYQHRIEESASVLCEDSEPTEASARHEQVCSANTSSESLAGVCYRFEVKQLNKLACSYKIGEINHALPDIGSVGKLPYTNEAGDEIGVTEA